MSTPRWQVDPDVRQARTLDKSFYLDTAVFDQVREQVFARAWHWLGRDRKSVV